MLPRILEAEVMDSAEEAHEYDGMDHAPVNRVFVDDFLELWDGAGPVLDVGTGTAQIPLELCRRYHDARVVGVDAAGHMLAVGRQSVARAGLTQRITLEQCDAKRLPHPDGAFPAVMSNSIVHHIPEPALVLGELLRVLRPGGALLVRDLLRPGSKDELDRLVALHAAGGTDLQRKMFADSLHAALALDEIRSVVAALGRDPASVTQSSDRHWTWAVAAGTSR